MQTMSQSLLTYTKTCFHKAEWMLNYSVLGELLTVINSSEHLSNSNLHTHLYGPLVWLIDRPHCQLLVVYVTAFFS